MLFITISAAVQSLTIFSMNKEVKKKIFYVKIGFRSTREMLPWTFVPITKLVSNQTRTNNILTIPVKT